MDHIIVTSGTALTLDLVRVRWTRIHFSLIELSPSHYCETLVGEYMFFAETAIGLSSLVTEDGGWCMVINLE